MFEIYHYNDKITEFEKGGAVNEAAWALNDFCKERNIEQAQFALCNTCDGKETTFRFRPHLNANEWYILSALANIGAMEESGLAWHKGYVSRKLAIGDIDCAYRGRYGEGYMLHFPTRRSTWYHLVQYFTWKQISC